LFVEQVGKLYWDTGNRLKRMMILNRERAAQRQKKSS
jgi:hypothetical protein